MAQPVEDRVPQFADQMYFQEEGDELRVLKDQLRELYRKRIRESLEAAGKSEKKVDK